jgi:hypothetical protein
MVRMILVALVAAGFAVPSSVASCCGSAKGAACCRKSSAKENSSATAAKRSCCHKAEPASSCATGTCPCCQESPPQNTPPQRVVDQLPTDFGLVAPAAILPVAETACDFNSLVATTNSATAIPHRILHCSWLI